MRIAAAKFRGARRKAVTLMGMSGVGKTALANRLPSTRWFIYSGDYRIGTQYLREPILDNIKLRAMEVPFLRDLLRSDSIYIESNITVHNLDPISTFLGQLGDPGRGGLPREEFLRRQELHRKAEVSAMRDVAAFIEKAERMGSAISPKPSRRSSRAGPSRGSSRTAGRYTPSWPPSTAIRFPRAPRSRCEAKRISWIWWPARSNRLAA